MTYHHGITPKELTQGILPMRNARTSTIGLVATADDADAERYPLNTPVLLTGITKDDITKAGKNGTLSVCLQTIRDIHNPTMIVMRVESLDDVNVLDELLTCQSRLGISPKILGVPELDTPKVVRKLVSIAKRRRAFVYASPRNDAGELLTDLADIVAYRNSFGDRELMIIDNAWGKPSSVGNDTGKGTHIPSTPVQPTTQTGSGAGTATNQATPSTGTNAGTGTATTTTNSQATPSNTGATTGTGGQGVNAGATTTSPSTTQPRPSYAVIGG